MVRGSDLRLIIGFAALLLIIQVEAKEGVYYTFLNGQFHEVRDCPTCLAGFTPRIRCGEISVDQMRDSGIAECKKVKLGLEYQHENGSFWPPSTCPTTTDPHKIIICKPDRRPDTHCIKTYFLNTHKDCKRCCPDVCSPDMWYQVSRQRGCADYIDVCPCGADALLVANIRKKMKENKDAKEKNGENKNSVANTSTTTSTPTTTTIEAEKTNATEYKQITKCPSSTSLLEWFNCDNSPDDGNRPGGFKLTVEEILLIVIAAIVLCAVVVTLCCCVINRGTWQTPSNTGGTWQSSSNTEDVEAQHTSTLLDTSRSFKSTTTPVFQCPQLLSKIWSQIQSVVYQEMRTESPIPASTTTETMTPTISLQSLPANSRSCKEAEDTGCTSMINNPKKSADEEECKVLLDDVGNASRVAYFQEEFDRTLSSSLEKTVPVILDTGQTEKLK